MSKMETVLFLAAYNMVTGAVVAVLSYIADKIVNKESEEYNE
ncbi:MAG: hypothetical protein PHD70_00280 [Anaerostipes sp.]|nr:hypothetical protein [Anaerostipes sp.]